MLKTNPASSLSGAIHYFLFPCLLLLISMMLTSCLDIASDDDTQNASECAEGSQEACDNLEEDQNEASEACNEGDTQACLRAALLEKLIESIPSKLVVASSTSVAEAGNTSEFASKQAAISEFFSSTSLSATSVSTCFDALPSKPQVQSPLCYGPNLDFEKHPDAPDANQADGQMPTGDLGLWVENEPGTEMACAAAKLNELVAKAAYQVDLAVGAMSMMVCAAAIQGESLPTTTGTSLDLSATLAAVSGEELTVKTATVELTSLTSSTTAYTTKLDATTSDGQPFNLTLLHDAENDKGLMVSETVENGDARGTSVVYSIGSTSISYRLVSGASQPQGGPNPPPPPPNSVLGQSKNAEPEISYADDGQVSLHNGNDIHVMVAEINASGGYGSLAYSWNAGGADDHYRTLNVVTDSLGEGRAYYGYTPSPGSTAETFNMDLSHADAGMICNWAGPGNSHQTNNQVQYQALNLTNGEWTATTSKIAYAPTVSCNLDTADLSGGTFFEPSFGDPGNPTPDANLTTEQQTLKTEGTINSTTHASGLTADLLNQSSIDFTMPTTPSVPE